MKTDVIYMLKEFETVLVAKTEQTLESTKN